MLKTGIPQPHPTSPLGQAFWVLSRPVHSLRTPAPVHWRPHTSFWMTAQNRDLRAWGLTVRKPGVELAVRRRFCRGDAMGKTQWLPQHRAAARSPTSTGVDTSWSASACLDFQHKKASDDSWVSVYWALQHSLITYINWEEKCVQS